jgi:hypothetical protein
LYDRGRFPSADITQRFNSCEANPKASGRCGADQHLYVLALMECGDMLRPYPDCAAAQSKSKDWIHSQEANQKSSPMEK